jgi:NDP-sugar pyrophosphorylase family protein
VNAATRTRGIVLAGQHTWMDSAFEALAARPLLPVLNQPLVSYAVLWLHEGGVRDVTVCANGATRSVATRLREHVPDDLNLAFHEDANPRGPAGCVRDAADDADTLVVADGTTIPLADLHDLLATHRATGAAATVVVHPEPVGASVDDRQRPTGIYIFDRRALQYIPARGFCDIKETLIPRLYRAGERTQAYRVREASPRVLDESTYLALNAWMVERLATLDAPQGYVRTSDVLVHESARVASDAVCVGPVVLGPGAEVMSRATVVGPTTIGAGSRVAPGALVSRSAVWSRCLVGDDAVADRCILADDCVVAPGTRAVGPVRARVVGRTTAPPPYWTTRTPLSVPRLRPQPGPVLGSSE